MTQSISTLMQRQVCVVEMEQTLGQVQALFADKRLSWAPVLEPRGEIIGVISDRDLVRFQAQGVDAAVPVWRLCTYKPISVDADTPIDEVARQMVERHIHHVVVTEQGRVAGVVSSLDFVRLCAAERPA
jgi:signal-transduction protein with cAMP-binding, CBS, and nucleotidyltransferase domain